MGKNNYNPGNVNTDMVIDNADGVNSVRRDDGSIHNTVYDKGENRRFSWNENPDGSTSEPHSTNQNNNSHNTYKGTK